MWHEHAPDLWSETRDFRVGGFLPLGTRMTVIRLPDGGLLLHSPAEIDDALAARLDALGPVRFLVAPNQLHYLFVASAAERYPDAVRLAAPGLPAKRPELGFAGELGDAPPPEWKDAVATHVVRGMPRVNEVAFLHRPSRTLVLTDLCFHVQHADSGLARLFFRVNGAWQRFGPSRLLRSMIRDRGALRRSIDHLLSWDFERVLVTHGEPLERDAREAFRRAWSWL